MTLPANQSSHHDNEAIRQSTFWKIYNKTAEKMARNTISSHCFDKCRIFVDAVNAADESFSNEISMLTYDALLFCSVSFNERDSRQLITERDPKKNRDEFKASIIHAYLQENRISIEKHRAKIIKRLDFYSRDGDKFRKLSEKVQSATCPKRLHHRYTFIRARKDVMKSIFTDSTMKEFEKMPQWGEDPWARTARMDLYEEGATLVVDVPQHVEVLPEVSGVFNNTSAFSGLTGLKITTQLAKQLVIEMPAREGVIIARTMFPNQP